MNPRCIVKVGQLFIERNWINIGSIQLHSEENSALWIQTPEEADKIVNWLTSHGVDARIITFVVMKDETLVLSD